MTDDAPDLEAEERAGRAQVEDDDRDPIEADAAELEIHVRHQEGVAIPA